MADDPAGQAIGIIGAATRAGLLRTAHDTSQPAEQVIGALIHAGVLAVTSCRYHAGAATTSRTKGR